MNAKELRQLNSRYVRIILDGDSERYINANFDALLEYIGSCFPLEGRTSIGSAYVRIRKETDRLLQVSWRENWSLKTSKREIKSIRQSSYWLPEKRGQHYYIMIPYKIGFIFTAIVNIVSEISQKESIPSSLRNCIEATYGHSFYDRHIMVYDGEYRRHFYLEPQGNPAKLQDVFHAPTSVFNRPFR